MTRIAKQEVLPRVGMTRIGKQEVMARVGRTRIVMHGRLPRGKSALDRELANILVGLGVWLDIDSDRAGYTGCRRRNSLAADKCSRREDRAGRIPGTPSLLTPNVTLQIWPDPKGSADLTAASVARKKTRTVAREGQPDKHQGRRSSRRRHPFDREGPARGRRPPEGATSSPAPAATARSRRWN
ncbi:hypothetical protein LWI29_022811 [Acer saccharum]|uniref:Uncharacterized protein n=1 Tax=Acer saccharum TaxID=4024 RepID=A0AA39SFY7_ACESA|nr:hypothetical protein LWI29_022811 [Acer saccharum]